MVDVGGLLVLGIILVVLLPFLLLGLMGTLYAIAYPVMLVWAILFSSKKLDLQIADTASREASLRESLGRDPGPHNPA
jgi:hypothetical protein